MAREMFSVKSFFDSINVPLSDLWLERCIEWCKSENLGPNYTLEELQHQVYEQWRVLDLRDIEVPSLPPNLSSKKHHTLSGNYCLQMMQAIDISKPKLWQLQKIRNSNVLTRITQQDSDVAGTGKRMLQLTLSDGVQEVKAMEYRPIACLNLNMAPGTKIRIVGPVTIRRGQLLLEPKNVKVLGGEVDELLVPNAAENVLAKILKLDLNPNPLVIEENLLKTDVDAGEGTQGYSRVQPQVQQSIRTDHPPPQNPNPRPTLPYHMTDEEEMRIAEEEMRIAEEVNLLLEAEESLAQPVVKKSSKVSDMFEDVSFNPDDFNHIDQVMSSTQACSSGMQPKKVESQLNKQKSISVTTARRNQREVPSTSQKTVNLSRSLDMDDDVFNDIDIDAHLDKLDKRIDQVQAPKVSVIPISRLLRNKDNISRGTFKIKAKFKSVVQKLTMDDDEYKIVLKIEDESGDITVKLHSDIISQFAGYDPAAIMSLKNNIVEKDGVALSKVMQALREVKDKLLKLDNVMEVQIVRGQDLPTVISVL